MDGFWDLVGIKEGLLSKNLAVNSFFFKRNYHFNFNSQSCTKLLAKHMYYPHIFIFEICDGTTNAMVYL